MNGQLSALDAFFLHGETPSQAMNLTGIGIYDPSTCKAGRMTLQTVLEHGAERTQRSPLFRRRPITPPFNVDQPYWAEDPQFDAKNHIFHSVLPAPGTRQQLDDEVARIHSLRIDRNGPLWEWWFIEGLDSIEGVNPGSFALVFKLHHAAFDGVAAWDVINVSHDLVADPPSGNNPPVDSQSQATAPSGLRMFAKGFFRAASQPLDLAKTLWGSAPIMRKLLEDDFQKFPLASSRAPRTIFNGSLDRGRVHRKVPLEIAKIKAMRQLVEGSTLNDVVLAIIGGSLRRYLAKHDSLPAKSLVVGVPISIRAKGNEGAAGNQAILALLPLGTDIEDHVTRLQTVHQMSSEKKDYVSDIPAHLLTNAFDFLPPTITDFAVRTFTELKLADRITLPYNLIVTNVPASRVPIYFAGAKMIQYDACGPIWDGAGLLHVITSYLGDLAISFDACSKQMQDPDFYVECLETTIAELSQIAGA